MVSMFHFKVSIGDFRIAIANCSMSRKQFGFEIRYAQREAVFVAAEIMTTLIQKGVLGGTGRTLNGMRGQSNNCEFRSYGY